MQKIKRPYTCEWCARRFQKRNHSTRKPRFCSQECSKESERAKRSKHTCERCGNVFFRRNRKTDPLRFCSLDCYYASRRDLSYNTNPIHTCQVCKEKFARRFRASKPPKFCSPECHSIAMTKRVELVCERCGQRFLKKRHGKDEKDPRFCSRKCFRASASLETKQRTRPIRKSLQRPCKLCGQFTLVDPYTHFCSRGCSTLSSFLDGRGDYRIRGFILTVQRKDKLCCEECGSENPHHLMVHHRDENRQNNADENLETLCANCHYEVHWKSAVDRADRVERALEAVRIMHIYLPGQTA